MYRGYLIDCLILYEDGVVDDHVSAKTHIDFSPSVMDRQRYFSADIGAVGFEFIGKALLIDRFEQAGAKGFVHGDGGMDDLFCCMFDIRHLID